MMMDTVSYKIVENVVSTSNFIFCGLAFTFEDDVSNELYNALSNDRRTTELGYKPE